MFASSMAEMLVKIPWTMASRIRVEYSSAVSCVDFWRGWGNGEWEHGRQSSACKPQSVCIPLPYKSQIASNLKLG